MTLAVQWLRIRLLMQGTQVWSLVWEDLTCSWATKPMGHNYWAHTLEPLGWNYWSYTLQLLNPARIELMLFNKKNLDLEASCKKSTDKPYIAIAQFPLLLALYISIKILTKTKNIILGQYYLLKLFIWISSTFYVMFLFLFQNLIWPSCCM